MNKKDFFISGVIIAATKFVLMPIISAVLIIAGLFTDILATWIGCGFLVLYIMLCLIFGARVAAVSDMADEEDVE